MSERGAGAAFQATRDLYRQQALFCGPTSGAAYLVAKWWAATHPEATTVVLLPDEGHRYVDTIYDDVWLGAVEDFNGTVPEAPSEVVLPSEAAGPWSTMDWNRRALDEVIAHEAERAA